MSRFNRVDPILATQNPNILAYKRNMIFELLGKEYDLYIMVSKETLVIKNVSIFESKPPYDIMESAHLVACPCGKPLYFYDEMIICQECKKVFTIEEMVEHSKTLPAPESIS